MERDIKILEEFLKYVNCKECKGYCDYCAIDNSQVQAIENIIKRFKELKTDFDYIDQEEHRLDMRNNELREEIKEYERILDIFDEREYRKRYLEERRAEEPNLLYPDADEIYKRYYELRENSVPKSKIEEKIKELEHIRDTALTFTTVEIMEHKIHILKLILEESEENK